jgi:pantoate kinase
VMKRARAFSPAGISSFFEICDRTPDEKPIVDLERVGARGGGFGLAKGVLTEVNIVESKQNSIQVFINGTSFPEADTTKTVARAILAKVDKEYTVTIRHKVEVPISTGFGSSAAGALSTAFALSDALGLHLTCNQLGRIAHVAEVKCKTGLGTVGPLLLGGCIVTVEPGAPGYGVIDRIPLTADHLIVAGVFEPWPTKEVLASPEKRKRVNEWGRKTVEAILAEPSLENFMRASKEFAVKTCLATKRVKSLIASAERAGAIGATQNMVGEAVHALTTPENLNSVLQAFKNVLPNEKVLLSKVDLQGVRLLRQKGF